MSKSANRVIHNPDEPEEQSRFLLGLGLGERIFKREESRGAGASFILAAAAYQDSTKPRRK